MNRYLSVIFLTFSIFIFSKCAQEGQLSGGPRDTVPPKIIRSLPKNYDTSFNQKKISIKFNEFIQLQNINNSFFSSVPMKNTPKFKVKGKKLIINFDTKLKDSTTYYFNFGNAITDFNEANPIKNFSLVFSTYQQIDTLEISGYLIDAYTNKPINNLTVTAFYNRDTLDFKSFPDYCASVDSNGKFIFKNLKKGKYNLLAFNDLNNNFQYDGFPENTVGFIAQNIIPYVKKDTIIDTIPKGALIQINDTLVDTLKQDSIKISINYKFLPDSIKLRIFTQLSDTQYIKTHERRLSGLLFIYFSQPLINQFININFMPSSKKFIIERLNKGDSLLVWLEDSSLYKQDSITALISYLNAQKKLITDTLIFSEYEKKKDSSNIQITIENKIIQNTPINLQTNSIIKHIDTNKIHLFKIIDTILKDTKKQKVFIKRPEPNKLSIKLLRPTVSIPIIDFPNLNNDTIYYNVNIKDKKNYTIFLLNDSLKKCDTLNFTIKFDNLYFFNQIQQLSEKVKIATAKQKISFKRPTNRTLIFTINKSTADFTVYPINLDTSLYKQINKTDTIFILLKKEIYDTLKFLVKAYNYTLNNKKYYLTDTISSYYAYEGNPIINAERYAKHKIKLVFKKPLISPLKIEILKPRIKKKWYKLKFLNNNKDTAYILITNNKLKRQKKLKIALNWYDININNDTLMHNDTIILITTQTKTTKDKQITSTPENKKQKQHLTLYQPQKFYIKIDTSNQHNLLLYTNLIPKYKYRLTIDTACITDIFYRTNDTINSKITVIDSADLHLPIITIKNIGKINNTKDTNKVNSGEIIINILDKDQNKIFTFFTKSDTTLFLPLLKPDNYTIQIIFDKNLDKIYTSGNIDNLIQPEPIWYKEVNLNNENKIILDFLDLKK